MAHPLYHGYRKNEMCEDVKLEFCNWKERKIKQNVKQTYQ